MVQKKNHYLSAWIFRSFSERLKVSLAWYLAIPFHFEEFCCIMWFRISGSCTRIWGEHRRGGGLQCTGGVLGERVPALKWALFWGGLALWGQDEPGTAADPGGWAADQSVPPSGSPGAGAERDSGIRTLSWEGKAALQRLQRALCFYH